MKNLNLLDPDQYKAVTTTKGYVRCIAGPGSGKTRALSTRLAYLVGKCNVPSRSILSLTFSNKAAGEIRKRAMSMARGAFTSDIFTFHGFCYRVLRGYIHLLDYPNMFNIMGADDQDKMFRDIYAEAKIPLKDFPINKMQSYISEKKSTMDYIPILMSSPEEPASKESVSSEKEMLDWIYMEYLRRQKLDWYLDFDDLLYFTVELFTQNKNILEVYQNKYTHILCDEYQDVCKAQFKIVNYLQGKHHNLFITGDPDQTIFSWRNADINYINNFDKYFPGTKTIFLNKNYRSAKNIVAVSNSLIKKNKNRIEKESVAVKAQAGKVSHRHCRDIYEEARFIAESIFEFRKNNNAEFRDIAVLYRSKYLNKEVEKQLIKFKIPYEIIRGQEFFKRKEIMDALAYLKFLVNDDNLSFLRIANKPSRKLSPKKIDLLKAFAKKNNTSLFGALVACREKKLFKHEDINNFINVVLDIRTKLLPLAPSLSNALGEILNRSGYWDVLLSENNSDRIENVRALQQSIFNREEETSCRLEL